MSSSTAPRSRTVMVVTLIFFLGAVVAGLATDGRRRATTAARPTIGVALGGGIFGLDDADLAADLDALAAAGVGWVRIDLDWSVAEPGPGLYRWNEADRLVAEADRAGLEVLAMVGYTPEWNRPEGSTDKHPPSDLGRFGDFTAAAAERYGDAVSAWEIWNEPNLERFWETGPDPADYAQLFVTGASGLRAGGATTPISTAGLAPATDDAPFGLSPETFLDGFFDALPADAGPDAVAIHPYSYPARPGGSQSWNLFARLPSIRRLVVDDLGRDVPIWLTEFGSPTGSGDRAVGESEQAEILVEAVECVAHWDWVENLFVFTLRDSAGSPDDDIEARFGLLRADGSPKPAFDALADRLAQPFDLSVSPCD